MTLDDIKRDLRVTHVDDDALLEVLIASAKDQALRVIERDTSRDGPDRGDHETDGQHPHRPTTSSALAVQ